MTNVKSHLIATHGQLLDIVTEFGFKREERTHFSKKNARRCLGNVIKANVNSYWSLIVPMNIEELKYVKAGKNCLIFCTENAPGAEKVETFICYGGHRNNYLIITNKRKYDQAGVIQ